MMVVSSSQHMIRDGESFMSPFTRYVIPNELGNECLKAKSDWTVSGIGSFERRYGGQDLNGKSVAVIRYHGIGDMLMVTGLVRYLREKYPKAIIHFYCLRSYASSVWNGNTDLSTGGYIPLPLTLDAMRRYEYHLFYDGMIECNAEPDQNNAYDDMFGFAGLHDVPSEYKHPFIFATDADAAWVKESGFDLDSRYILFQLHSSSDIRTYPPELTAKAIRGCLDKFPEHKVVLAGEVLDDALKAVAAHESVVNAVGAMRSWRHMIPLIQHAAAIVCPDSSVGHIAAAFPEVPVVSLWGPFSFASRAKHYANHHPLEVKACPKQPCWTHGLNIPKDKCASCPGFSDGEKYCMALRAITPQSIVDKLAGVMRAVHAKTTHPVPVSPPKEHMIDLAGLAKQHGITFKGIAEVGVNMPEKSALLPFLDTADRILMVEPLPRCMTTIRAKWGADSRFRLTEGAVTEDGNATTLYDRDEGSYISDLDSCFTKDNKPPTEILCNLPTTKDEAIAVNGINFASVDDGKIDLLAVDTEGAEWFVLKNLKSRPAMICLETHLSNHAYVNPHIDKINKWMADNGYKECARDDSDTVWIKKGTSEVIHE